MKATLVFVPPGGGEVDHQLNFDLPSPPQRGDYICVSRPGSDGFETFVVRRSWWMLEHPLAIEAGQSSHKSNAMFGSLSTLVVECEFALDETSSPEHRHSCEEFARQRGRVKRFDETLF